MKLMRILPITIAIALLGCKKDDEKKAETPPKTTADAAPKVAAVDAAPAAKPEIVKLDGFQTPESMLYDDQADLYLVANIEGAPFDKDGKGFIARVSPPPDAKIVDAAWIRGLNAPKGMALLGDVLYVADIDAVKMFDRKTGAAKGEVAIKGAKFLNDLVAGDGVVYASDTALDKDFKPGKEQAIYEIKDGKATKLAGGEELGGPNGLAVVDGELWVVTFGSGEIYKVKDGKRDAIEKLPKGQLDGIVRLGDGRILVSSWEGKTVFVGKPGAWVEGPTGVPSPADVGVDTKRNLLLIPVFTENRVEVHPLPNQ